MMFAKLFQKVKKAVRRIPCVSLRLSLAALGIHLCHPLRLALIYDRTAIDSGEFLRLLSCHWVHLNTDHLLWSGITFLGLGSLCEIFDKKKYYITLGISAVLIPVLIFFGMPDLQIYAGLSGLDCALYALLITMLLKREAAAGSRTWQCVYFLLLVLLILKTGFEVITGMHLFVSNSHAEMTSVPLAHLSGGLIGCMVGYFHRLKLTPPDPISCPPP